MEFKEVEQIVKDCDYRYASLWKDGECIENWNKAGNATAKITAIRKRLISQPPGEYVVCCRNSVTGKIDEFPFSKLDGAPAVQTTMSETINPKFLENKAYMDLAIKNAELIKDQEISSLKDQIRNLMAENKELREQLEEFEEMEEAPLLNEAPEGDDIFNGPGSKFFMSLMEHAAPLFDRHYELKAKQLDIEQQKLNLMHGPKNRTTPGQAATGTCLLYTSDAADD